MAHKFYHFVILVSHSSVFWKLRFESRVCQIIPNPTTEVKTISRKFRLQLLLCFVLDIRSWRAVLYIALFTFNISCLSMTIYMFITLFRAQTDSVSSRNLCCEQTGHGSKAAPCSCLHSTLQIWETVGLRAAVLTVFAVAGEQPINYQPWFSSTKLM